MYRQDRTIGLKRLLGRKESKRSEAADGVEKEPLMQDEEAADEAVEALLDDNDDAA